jgi:hypothetical protein
MKPAPGIPTSPSRRSIEVDSLFDRLTAAGGAAERLDAAELRNFCEKWIAARRLMKEAHGSSLPIASRVELMTAATAAVDNAIELGAALGLRLD